MGQFSMEIYAPTGSILSGNLHPDVQHLLPQQRIACVEKAVDLSEAVPDKGKEFVNLSRREVAVAAVEFAVALELEEMDYTAPEALVEIDRVNAPILPSIGDRAPRLIEVDA